MKKKLQLNVVVKLKSELESKIEQLGRDIVRMNNSGTGVEDLLESLKKHQDQLVTVKLAMAKAANTKSKLFGQNGNYFIYHYSRLRELRKLYLRMINKLSGDKSQYNATWLNKERQTLYSEMKAINTKLTKFNEKSVSLEIDEGLNLNI